MHETPGQKLRRAVLEKWPRMTLREFADNIGERPDVLSGYLHGYRTPPKEFWREAEDVLDLPEGYLDAEEEESALVAD